MIVEEIATTSYEERFSAVATKDYARRGCPSKASAMTKKAAVITNNPAPPNATTAYGGAGLRGY